MQFDVSYNKKRFSFSHALFILFDIFNVFIFVIINIYHIFLIKQTISCYGRHREIAPMNSPETEPFG